MTFRSVRFPGNPIPGLSIKALHLTLAVLILAIVVIKPKELFSFLGLNGNILKGFGVALLAYHLFILYSLCPEASTEQTFHVLYIKLFLLDSRKNWYSGLLCSVYFSDMQKQVTTWSRTACLQMPSLKPSKTKKALHIIDT